MKKKRLLAGCPCHVGLHSDLALARAAGAAPAVGDEAEVAVEGGISAEIRMGADAFGEASEQSGEAAVGLIAGVAECAQSDCGGLAVKNEAPVCGNGFPEPLRRVRASSTDAEEAGVRIIGWESTGWQPGEVPAAGTRMGTGVKSGELSRKCPQAGRIRRKRFLLDCRENGARLSLRCWTNRASSAIHPPPCPS